MKWLMPILVVLVLGGCKVLIPVDSAGAPTGEPAGVTFSESGDMEAVTVDPTGVETPVEMTTELDAGAIGEAVGAGTALLPPPWNIIGSLAFGGLALLGKKKDK